jgi:hypothetical protein
MLEIREGRRKWVTFYSIARKRNIRIDVMNVHRSYFFHEYHMSHIFIIIHPTLL